MSVEQLRDLIEMIELNKITGNSTPSPLYYMCSSLIQCSTGTSGKQLLKHMVENPTSKSPEELARELSILALQDDVGKLCQNAIDALPEEADVIRKGNTKVLNKLVGYVMRLSKGRANAQIVQARLKGMLLGK